MSIIVRNFWERITLDDIVYDAEGCAIVDAPETEDAVERELAEAAFRFADCKAPARPYGDMEIAFGAARLLQQHGHDDTDTVTVREKLMIDKDLRLEFADAWRRCQHTEDGRNRVVAHYLVPLLGRD